MSIGYVADLFIVCGSAFCLDKQSLINQAAQEKDLQDMVCDLRNSTETGNGAWSVRRLCPINLIHRQ